MKRNAWPLALAGAVAGMTACGRDHGAETISTSSRSIQGGTNDTSDLFAVGILAQTSRGTALCSGALLAPNLVATARHCVAAIPASGVIDCPSTQFGALTPASSFVVTTDADVRTGSTRLSVSKVIVPSAADQTSVCGDDIALLILSQNVSLPAYVTPVLSPPMTDHTVYSTTVTAIGYGVSSPTDMTGTTAGIRRIKQQIPLTCIANDKTFTDCLPSMASQVTATEFVSGDGTCEGDSGSNAFEQRNFDAGKWVSFGVLSRGGTIGSTCVGGIYSRFDAWAPLIIDAANQAAVMGGYAVPPWAGPDGGTVPPGDAGSDGAPPRDAGSDAVPPRDSGASSDTSADTSSSDASRDASLEVASSDAAHDAVADAARDADATRAPDGGRPDAGADTGPQSDSGSPGGDGGGPPPPASGCSCATEGTGPASGRPPWPVALVGLGVTLAAIRRRGGRPVGKPSAAETTRSRAAGS